MIYFGEKTLVRIAVLMTTFNGEKFLIEQMNSIISQVNVEVSIFVSDDGSTDKTLEIIKMFGNKVNIIPRSQSCGSAGHSFLKLLHDVDITGYDYISFSDQDDIWLSGKLIRAVEVINRTMSIGYSANDIAFWPDRSTCYSLKSLPQKKYDHYFESIGRGSSFVIRVEGLQQFKNEVLSEGVPKIKNVYHDWLIYAFFRERNLKWVSDDYIALLYRQHNTNSLGANYGLKAAIARFDMLRTGKYGSIIKDMFNLINPNKSISKILSRPWILKNIFETRRNKKHMCFLFVYSLFFKL